MAHPRILHMITPLKHMSPFDVNMALDAGYDAAIPYTSVTVEDVTGLVQDAIFSRGPEGVKKTAMFIGGKRAIEALDMMKRPRRRWCRPSRSPCSPIPQAPSPRRRPWSPAPRRR